MLLLALLALHAPALANGQTSHLWITDAALERLPEGELKDLLTREDLRPWLRNGTMFPDGGYAVDDGYGEIAHWEPFQSLYLDWIVEDFSPPWSDEAAQHIAFLMGLASHGMADQVYDALYLEEGYIEDADSEWSRYSADEAADVVFSSLTGPQEVPEDVVPYALMVELFDVYGHEVSVETLEDGQSLLRVAVNLVGQFGQTESAVQLYTARFPWVTSHQQDPLEWGKPADEADVIAIYWQVLWERLHGEDWMSEPVIATFPASPDDGLPLSAGDYDARPAVVFARGNADDDVRAGLVSVSDAEGADFSVEPDLYYRNSSHVLLFVPEMDWVEDQIYTVTVQPGVEFLDGRALEEPWSFTLRAGQPVPEPDGDTGAPGAADTAASPDGARGCGCVTAVQPSPGGPAIQALLALGAFGLVVRRRSR